MKINFEKFFAEKMQKTKSSLKIFSNPFAPGNSAGIRIPAHLISKVIEAISGRKEC